MKEAMMSRERVERVYVDDVEERSGSGGCVQGAMVFVFAIVVLCLMAYGAREAGVIADDTIAQVLGFDVGQLTANIRQIRNVALGGLGFWMFVFLALLLVGVRQTGDEEEQRQRALYRLMGGRLPNEKPLKRHLQDWVIHFLEKQWIPGIFREDLTFKGGKELRTLIPNERIEDWRQQEWWIYHLQKTRPFLEIALLVSFVGSLVAGVRTGVVYVGTGDLSVIFPMLGTILKYTALPMCIFLVVYWIREYSRRNTLWILTSFRMFYVRAGGSFQGFFTGKSSESSVLERRYEDITSFDSGSHPEKLRGLRIPLVWDEVLDYKSASVSVRSFDMEYYFEDPKDRALNIPHGVAFVNVQGELGHRGVESEDEFREIKREAGKIERDQDLGTHMERKKAADEHLRATLPRYTPSRRVNIFAVRYREKRKWNNEAEEVIPDLASLSRDTDSVLGRGREGALVSSGETESGDTTPRGGVVIDWDDD